MISDADQKAAWGADICALVDAAFEKVSRNPSDHEEHLAYRLAIMSAREQAERETIEKVVAWLRGQSDTRTLGDAYSFAADALESGAWREGDA